MMKLNGILLAALLAGAATSAMAQGVRLSPPFRTVPPQAGAPAGNCPAVPPAPISLHVDSPYKKGDPTFSHLDLQAEAAVDALVKPIRDFYVAVDVQAGRYTMSNGANEAAGACALAMMDSWASQNAVSQLTNHDAHLFRANMISALAIDFMQVRGLNTGDPDQRRRIANWLHSLAEDSLEHWRSLPPDSMVNHNNHRAWAALATAATGVATNDPSLLRWGVESAKVVACEADGDGALPREIGRAARARLYSLYAAEPLVITAELAAANGQDLYGACNGAVRRIADFALRAVDDPSQVEAKSGVRQESFYKPDGSFNKAQIAWAEVYHHRFPDAPLPANFAAGKPYFAPDLGGGIGALVNR
ncbi:alginate lyase family protein [Phenylobacterium montanum]|uniref:Alginate lyase family protein n=1 Tax=Phenylobacterium montanum TaxID=2823693 RepID=A0A975IUN2_9CAUL|nr:alginate lyase family protein [Caulobacter sp. S6]QUD87915.1 alginate lyase family protein [Caulobacter sp. S6]